MTAKVKLLTDRGTIEEALTPVIVSASRATDIPAFYAPWLFHRLEKGYVKWINPFNHQGSYVSFSKCRFIVFWSKNPRPLLRYLPQLKEKGIGCYIQYTLNDYEDEGLERQVPPLGERIDTFRALVDLLGAGSVIWRFDPLVITDKTPIPELLEKVSRTALRLSGYAQKLVFSFADIGSYRRVAGNLSAAGIRYREWTAEDMEQMASGLKNLNLGLQLATCAEKVDLQPYGIDPNRCIDPDLIYRIGKEDETLVSYLSTAPRDKGQRPLCHCIASKDIGQYGTCPHGCLYCYANSSPSKATEAYHHHLAHQQSESII